MLRNETFTVYNCLTVFLQSYQGQTWEGTARQLLQTLQPYVTRWPHGTLPSNERALVVELKKLDTLNHLTLSYHRKGKRGVRLIQIQKQERAGSGPPYLFPL